MKLHHALAVCTMMVCFTGAAQADHAVVASAPAAPIASTALVSALPSSAPLAHQPMTPTSSSWSDSAPILLRPSLLNAANVPVGGVVPASFRFETTGVSVRDVAIGQPRGQHGGLLLLGLTMLIMVVSRRFGQP